MTTTKTAAALEVAVIGAGAAGLAAARVLSRNGINPVVFEQSSSLGGVWDYRDDESTKKQKPMYQNLRTNLPKELMAYREKKWTGVDHSYVTHQEVLEYLNEYKTDFELDRFIRYNSKVIQLTVLTNTDSKLRMRDEILPKLRVEWQESSSSPICSNNDDNGTTTTTKSQVFDAVCVANGHYAKPSIPPSINVPSSNKVQTMHSMEYNDPNDFRDQTVVCIGGRASGSDLARELSQTAKRVYVSYSGATKEDDSDNLSHVPHTTAVNQDGTIEFEDGSSVQADVVIYCTGYDYQFPFLNGQSQLPRNENEGEEENDFRFSVQPGERRVKPLYKHFLHAGIPNLSFPGLQHSVVPFPYVELQAEAWAHELFAWSSSSSKSSSSVPDRAARYQAAAMDATLGGAKQTGRIQDTHYLGGGQWDYCRDMAKMAQLYNSDMEDFIRTNQAIYEHSGQERASSPPGSEDNYRETRYKRNYGTGGGFEVLSSGISSAVESSASSSS